MPLGELSEALGEGSLSDEDIRRMSEFCALDADEMDVLLDIIHFDSEYAPKEASGEDLAEYATEAYTGFDSLNEWAESDMDCNRGFVEPGETADDYARSALINEIWVLPRRSGDGYRVMSRAEAL